MRDLLRPDDPRAPKYWRHETSGALAVAVERYLVGAPMSPHQVELMALYLRQWIDSPVWDADDQAIQRRIVTLRRSAQKITRWRDIRRWIDVALDLGIDPL
jgi:hypothetical protein